MGSITMREPDELMVEMANTVAALSAVPERIWVCEGPDDREALEHHDPTSLVFVAGNRRAVLAVAERLGQAQQRSRRWRALRAILVGLVDRDYADPPQLSTVKVTNTCSLEGDLLLASGGEVLRRLVLSIDHQEAGALVDRVMRLGDEFGRLRLHAEQASCALRLDRFPVGDAVRGDDIDWERVVELLHERHPGEAARVADAVASARGLKPCPVPCKRSNGHDLVNLLHHVANSHPKSRTQISSGEVFRCLVGAADPSWVAALSRA